MSTENEKDLPQSDLGSIVTRGAIPGMGKVQTMDQVIKEAQDKSKEAVDIITSELQKVEEAKKLANPPSDLIGWFNLRHAQKKSEIVRTKDPARLNYIAQWDKDEKVLKLINQRHRELKGE